MAGQRFATDAPSGRRSNAERHAPTNCSTASTDGLIAARKSLTEHRVGPSRRPIAPEPLAAPGVTTHPATSYRRNQWAVSPISTKISNECQGIEQRLVVAVRPSPHRSRCGSPGDRPCPYVVATTSIVECQEVVTNRACFRGVGPGASLSRAAVAHPEEQERDSIATT